MEGVSSAARKPIPALRALTFDYWDTLYVGAPLGERVRMRRAALREMVSALGREIGEDEFVALYRASGTEAERWWREEHRGYRARDRIGWLLERLDIQRPSDCEHVARAVAAVDEALLLNPPPLLAGAANAVRALAGRFSLAIVSDTGFASGVAQDRLLEQDGLLQHFAVRVYSCDVGRSKPHCDMFISAVDQLGLRPEEVLHVGDLERTDVRGALDAGLRAVRLDVVRPSGDSAAELVARSYAELVERLSHDGCLTL